MKYEAKIINKPFTKDGIQYDNTAKVTIYRDDGDIDNREYGYVEMPDIEQQIEIGSDIRLDFCFIENFMLNGRKIKSFSSRDAFYGGKADFRDAQFNGEAELRDVQFSEEAQFRNAQFNGGAYFSGAQFNGEAEFRDVQFSEEAQFREVKFNGEAHFPGAKFNGEAHFSDVQFREEAQFREVKFNGEAHFPGAQFNGEAHFSWVQFSREANFCEAKLGGLADFDAAQFRGEANFFKTHFNGIAQFNGARFGGEAYFSEAHFNGIAQFSGARFSGEAYFSEVKFSGEANFTFVKFLAHVFFMNSTCKVLILTNCIIEKLFDLSNAKFEKLSLKNLENLGYIYLEWNEHISNSIYKYVSQIVASPTPYWDIAKQYRLLKENFHKIGQYNDEDKAYVEFRRYEALSEWHGEHAKNAISKIKNKLLFLIKWVISDLIGVYATSPIRILSSLIISIGSFGAVYYLCHVGVGKFGIGILQNVEAALYYSAITAFTAGYEGINPTSFAAHNQLVSLLTCIEAFVGLFLMAYFTVAFSRKVLR
jgi:uncharacterized protein YjbI with pentapeptide repeats